MSSIFKELTAQGFIIVSVEHRDFSALSIKLEENVFAYIKNLEMRDYSKLNI
jgi:hypothetical protein